MKPGDLIPVDASKVFQRAPDSAAAADATADRHYAAGLLKIALDQVVREATAHNNLRTHCAAFLVNFDRARVSGLIDRDLMRQADELRLILVRL